MPGLQLAALDARLPPPGLSEPFDHVTLSRTTWLMGQVIRGASREPAFPRPRQQRRNPRPPRPRLLRAIVFASERDLCLGLLGPVLRRLDDHLGR